MIAVFPRAGRRIEHAYTELDLAAGSGTRQQQNVLGDPRLLARPWDPASCVDPQLRAQIWQWLEQVVTWLNHEYAWDPDSMIPSCWPRHPHLVHEIAVLADFRRRAGLAVTADALEEWHRYALPAFTDRMRQRLRQHCQDSDHEVWPAQGRYTRHQGDESRRHRAMAYGADVATLAEHFGKRGSATAGGAGRPNPQAIDGMQTDVERRGPD
ncbi:hypothetical protein [Cellulomonas sp. C5510]|uniref:hypothetical protein n=1 Tax=Cellulomonas sp. C5510 TaxID=2871170 RepID=UPI001C93BFA0|nr:hypothetical protein [Cellulomonas sp. C5510]QZN87076.1 hypothetical protein K5O09_08225 [Cellulomonas sp. C5510]